MSKRHIWSHQDIQVLRALFTNNPTLKVAKILCLTESQVNHKAYQLDLKKSDEYLSSNECGRLRPGSQIGAKNRFPKGHVPANKGVKGVCYEGCKATQFKPGQKPGNWMPIGSERYSKEGYLQRKMTDTGYPPRDWVAVHLLLWIEHNGAVPPGHCIIFADGDKRNITITNLNCITRRENMLRNSIHKLPAELVEIIQLKGSLQRRITCHERHKHIKTTPV